VRTFRSLVAVAAAVAALPISALSAQEAACRSLRYRSNFRLNSANNYINDAERPGRHPDDVNRSLNNARRVLNEALQNQQGTDAATLWFLNGKVHAIRGELAGADSSFTRAAAAITGDDACLREIVRLRRNAWIPVYNEAIAQLQAQNYDSTIALMRKGNLIYRDDPAGYTLMANAFMQQDKYDSSATAFRMAATAGTDTTQAARAARADAMFNAARLYSRAGLEVRAESAYRAFLVMKPGDLEGVTGLAGSLTAQGRGDAAAALYDSLLGNAAALSSFDLFDMGVALFRVAQADSTNAARQKARFGQAARAFEAGLLKNPQHRDALYNLTNTYLAAGDTAKVLDAARRLVGVDSLNSQSLTLLARAHQMNRQTNDVVRVLQRRDSLPIQIQIARFEPGDSTARVRGVIANMRTAERPAFTLTIEFVSEQGAVVATQRIDVPALAAIGSGGDRYDFNVTASGRGIVTYRYRI
jgi:tetratricopeptide (TPR) repeat protein